jgi:lambda repressor-like predicted transcriptional regulator
LEDKKNKAIILELQARAEKLREINNENDIKINSLSETLTEAQKKNENMKIVSDQYAQKIEQENKEI